MATWWIDAFIALGLIAAVCVVALLLIMVLQFWHFLHQDMKKAKDHSK